MEPTTHYIELACPSCGQIQECHTSIGQGSHAPTEGTLSLCVNCLGWSIYTETPYGLLRRMPSQQEYGTILTSSYLQSVYAATARVWQARRRSDGSSEESS